jgi:hypothetical protein
MASSTLSSAPISRGSLGEGGVWGGSLGGVELTAGLMHYTSREVNSRNRNRAALMGQPSRLNLR